MTRIDAVLAARGLARSRTHAARLLAEGLVTLNGEPVLKASTAVADTDTLEVSSTDHYVSRAAHKLIAALDAWDIPVAGKTALDVGASTGGFTQVLRERGAEPVLAVDVGHDQLADVVRADPGVRVVEGYNVRDMTPASLAGATGVATAPSIIAGDLSFISLTHVLPALTSVADPAAEMLLLVKPQFEVGRGGVRGGVVNDPAARADAVAGVLWAAWDLGLGTAGVIASPLLGTHGNREYLVHLNASSGVNPTEYRDTINTLTGA